MKYTKDDRDFIESWLNKCVKIEKDNYIYYVTTPNILRQLKYNRLLSKKEINIDLINIDVDLININVDENVILQQDLKNNEFCINYYKIWSKLQYKYNVKYKYSEINDLINNILCDILNLKSKKYNTVHFYSIAV